MKHATVNEVVICKYSGKKYIAACQKVLSVLLAAGLAAAYFLVEQVASIVDGLALPVVGGNAVLTAVALAVAGILGGIVVGLIWGLIVNLFRVPSKNKKEQKSYLDMSALRVQLDSQRTILCEGDAKINKIKGRLYVTAGAIEYYAGSENNFTNYFLVPLYEVKKVKTGSKKVVVVTKMKKFVLKVAPFTGKAWKKAVKEALVIAGSAPIASNASKKAAKKVAKKAKKAAK